MEHKKEQLLNKAASDNIFHYPVRSFRIADKNWVALQEDRKRNGLSWNMYIEMLRNKLKIK